MPRRRSGAAAWKAPCPKLVPVHPPHEGAGLVQERARRDPAAFLADLSVEEIARLADELTRTREGQLVLGRVVAAEDAARWKPADYTRAARETFHVLAPLYRLR